MTYREELIDLPDGRTLEVATFGTPERFDHLLSSRHAGQHEDGRSCSSRCSSSATSIW